MNILFTCVGRRVALLEGFRRALRQLGLTGKLVGTDVTASSSAFQRADVGVIVPSVGCVEYVPALLEIVRSHDIRLVVPLTDLDLRSLARQAEKFSALGCTVMVGNEEAVSLCRNKQALNAMLRRIGLATIRTCTLAEFQAKPFYPCFVKPVRGSASVGTSRICSAQELISHLQTFGEAMLIQEYVSGQEFTIDVYRSRDGRVRCVVPRQRLVVRSGEVEKAMTRKDEELIAAATKLAETLDGLWGVFCCQCRRDRKGRPRFFEVNPRFGGGAPLSIAAGADLPLYLLQEVLGMPITAEIGAFTDRLVMLRYDEAVFMPATSDDDLPGFQSPVIH
jgi:carbamoyl-phosphate synthase large subunit